MEVKIFEIRDRATFFPAMCIRAEPKSKSESFLLSGAGFIFDEFSVIFIHAGDLSRSNYNPQAWGDRTLQTAHEFIRDNWGRIESGEVIDVEFILGETKTKKVSEAM